MTVLNHTSFELISKYIATHDPLVLGAGIFCAIPTLDLTLCAWKDFEGINFTPPVLPPENQQAYLTRQEKLRKSLRTHAIAAVIFGACSANLFPRSGAVGALGFLVYSRFAWELELESPHPALTVQLTGFALKVLSVYKKSIARWIFSKSIEIGRWACSWIQTIAAKVMSCARAIIHAIKIGLRAAGRFCHYAFVLPARGLRAVGHVFKVFFHALRALVQHPAAGLGVLAGAVCLIGAVKYRHLLKGAMRPMARLIHRCAKGVLKALPYVLRGVGKTIKFLGKALWALPYVLIKIVKTIASIFRVILHPREAWNRQPAPPRV